MYKFKVGQTVCLTAEQQPVFTEFERYTGLYPEPTEVGLTGVIHKYEDYAGTGMPDCFVELSNGNFLWLEVCWLVPVAN